MTRILALTNQKGGVGKTTSCVNLAASLAATKRRVLLVDLDPQGNATMSCGVDKYDLPLSVYHVLTDQCSAKEAIVYSEAAEMDILPANSDLTAAEVALIETTNGEGALFRALSPVKDDYDFILIDSPPSLNMLTVNALMAADGVIVPMQCEYYALEGLTALMETISGIAATGNPRLHVEGLLRTMYDPRNSLTVEVSRQLISHFGNKVYRTVIPRNVRLAEAPSYGLPVMKHDKRSRGAIAYLALAGEIIRRQEASTARQTPAMETALR